MAVLAPPYNVDVSDPESFSGKLVWAALRQLEALRESLTYTLDGELLFRATKEEAAELRDPEENFIDGRALLTLDKRTLPVWLRQQDLPDYITKDHPSIATAMEGYRIHLLGPSAYKALRSGQRSAHQESEDFGSERSGAGWMRSINFCITSAFVRLLGAWEQYEVDVVKALFYYRPTGQPLGSEDEHIPIQAEESVIREQPVPEAGKSKRLVYAKPPLWTWLRTHVENNGERRTIMSRVFRVEPTEDNALRDQLYDKRHAIAHGRADVEITLAKYVEADVFVYRSIAHLAEQCRTMHKLIV